MKASEGVVGVLSSLTWVSVASEQNKKIKKTQRVSSARCHQLEPHFKQRQAGKTGSGAEDETERSSVNHV